MRACPAGAVLCSHGRRLARDGFGRAPWARRYARVRGCRVRVAPGGADVVVVGMGVRVLHTVLVQVQDALATRQVASVSGDTTAELC